MATQTLIRDLTPRELSDIQKRFPGIKEGEYRVFTIMSGQSLTILNLNPEPGKPAS